MYITPNTASRNPTPAAPSANATDTSQQPAGTPPSASNNPPLSGAQAARAADAARDRVTCHQDALQRQEYERQLVKWESEAPAEEVGGRQRAAVEIRPVIESGEKTLILEEGNLTSLPLLPQGLKRLAIGTNHLTSLPTLPLGLTELSADSNRLTSLPTLPSGLTELSADNNKLTSLPTLPNGLTKLRAFGNQLTSLPKLPDVQTETPPNSHAPQP
ncbi:hypothetical protein [Actimicrobium antarcticum]|uniref:Uncharacterized protein n=1 Tax=Actimicrobium antarcticum TaxID=1051899 RepID=A0ABP7SWA4_9BURK